ncbi:MAG: hypothetical protein DLM50_00180 [Candidatus Meridianibacter frigidus]|nr:MAG: hypothetical protein DLM50_00180 [Candidatus Eremiobacteraeota bacterium]
MQRLTTAALASAFAITSMLAVFAGSARHAALGSATIMGGGALAALADKDDHRDKDQGGDKNCINPAGKVRGFCKHGDNDNGRGHLTFVTGTVVSVSGNIATLRVDNGSIVQVNEQSLLNRGIALAPGRHYTLRGSFSGGVFIATGVTSVFGGPYSGASIRGIIVSINGNTVRIAQGLNLITINDSRAAARGTIFGSLFIGRTITAFGNWSGSVFLANRIQ